MKINKKSISFGLIFFVIVIFFGSFIGYSYLLNNNIENTIINILEEDCKNKSDVTTLDDMLTKLQSTAFTIGKYDSLEEKSVDDILNNRITEYKFLQVDLINSDGVVLNGNGNNVAKCDYFKRAIKGDVDISNCGKIGKSQYINITVPIYKNYTVIGVLRGKCDLDMISGAVSSQYKYITKITLLLSLILISIFIFLTIYIVILLRKRTAILKHSKNQLDTLTSNIPGGVQCCESDEFLTIKYISDGFLSLTGFTRDEIAINFNDKYIKMIYPKDRDAVLATMKKCNEKFFEIQYRLIRKDGTVIWILDKGQLVTTKDAKDEYYCVLVDISEVKRAEKELMKSRHELAISNERYQIVINQSGSIVFDYDFTRRTIFYSNLFRKIFGYNPPTEDYPNSIIDENIIHPDDIQRFQKFCETLAGGINYSEDELRFINSTGEYMWCSIQANTILDNIGVPIKAIGRITDISKRKSETLRLVDKSQIDLLTGLLNKTTTQNFIEGYLTNNKNVPHALLVLSINNFETISDNLSSQIGDIILLEISQKLQKLFRSTDIVGRIGEEQFMIFIKDCTIDLIIRKASEICAYVNNLDLGYDNTHKISGNIGISLSPQDDVTYEGLYKKADIALFISKRNGKNSYEFFEEPNE